MEINRRGLLKYGGGGAAVALLGGLQFARRSYARDSLYQDLMRDTLPVLTGKAAKEIEPLPASAREEIREYFHGACLNVHAFTTEICSVAFAEKLAVCGSENKKHQLLNVTFSQKVVTSVEVLNRVQTIASETGRKLDRNWAGCCDQLSASWNTSITKRTSITQSLDASALVAPLILQSLDDARHIAYPAGQRPAISETIIEIGASAIKLFAIAEVAPAIVLPFFVVEALAHIWRLIIGQLSDRSASYQTAITEQLAILGNRVGAECEQEFRRRIADLHEFQDRALREAAHRKVNEIIPAFF